MSECSSDSDGAYSYDSTISVYSVHAAQSAAESSEPHTPLPSFTEQLRMLRKTRADQKRNDAEAKRNRNRSPSPKGNPTTLARIMTPPGTTAKAKPRRTSSGAYKKRQRSPSPDTEPLDDHQACKTRNLNAEMQKCRNVEIQPQ